MMPLASPSAPSQGHAHTNAAIAPAPSIGSVGEDSGDGRKAKRELSQSKRAAQNRAAQRAFRQRKEYYIKKLEQQVRDYIDMETSFKTMQSENYALREYVIHLQSRLIDAQCELPQPPPNVNLSQPPTSAPSQAPHPHSSVPPPFSPSHQQGDTDDAEPVHHPSPPSGGSADSLPTPGAGTPLEAVAKAVAGLAAQEQLREKTEDLYSSNSFTAKKEPGEEDMRSAEEINRHLQAADTSGHESAA